MLIEVDDPRTVSVMGLLQHCNSSELKELLNEDALEHPRFFLIFCCFIFSKLFQLYLG